jgi:hypothetical protein
MLEDERERYWFVVDDGRAGKTLLQGRQRRRPGRPSGGSWGSNSSGADWKVGGCASHRDWCREETRRTRDNGAARPTGMGHRVLRMDDPVVSGESLELGKRPPV